MSDAERALEPVPAPAPPPPAPPWGPLPALGPAWLRGLLFLPLGLAANQVGSLLAMLVLEPEPAGFAWIMLVGSVAGCLALMAGWLAASGAPLVALGHAGPSRRVVRGLIGGTVVGAALMAAIVGTGLLAGAWTTVRAPTLPPAGPLLTWTLVLLVAAYYEELLLRGCVLQELGRKRLVVGVAISSTIFALVHLLNPNTFSAGAVGVALLVVNIVVAGLLLAAAYLHAGDLWLPTGVHFGWNWAQAILFGLPVSGIDLPSILDGDIRADAPGWAASAFGPEASVFTLIVTGAACAAWWVVVHRQRRQLPVVTDALSRQPPPPQSEAPTPVA